MATPDIRLNKEDRLNLKSVKLQMVKLGFPESSISVSDVMRFALKATAKQPTELDMLKTLRDKGFPVSTETLTAAAKEVNRE